MLFISFKRPNLRVDKNVAVQPRTRILQNITLKALFTQAILCD
jgi:hypothetical protein